MTQGRKIDDSELVEISGGVDGGTTEPAEKTITDSAGTSDRGDAGGGGGGGTGFDETTGSGGTQGVDLGN